MQLGMAVLDLGHVVEVDLGRFPDVGAGRLVQGRQFARFIIALGVAAAAADQLGEAFAALLVVDAVLVLLEHPAFEAAHPLGIETVADVAEIELLVAQEGLAGGNLAVGADADLGVRHAASERQFVTP